MVSDLCSGIIASKFVILTTLPKFITFRMPTSLRYHSVNSTSVRSVSICLSVGEVKQLSRFRMAYEPVHHFVTTGVSSITANSLSQIMRSNH
jgi:hypothetical protein